MMSGEYRPWLDSALARTRADLLEVKREILRLRAQMRRPEEKRDILKKAAAYLCPPVLCQGDQVRYAFIRSEEPNYSLHWLCKIMTDEP